MTWILLLACGDEPVAPPPPEPIDVDRDGSPAGEDCDDADRNTFPGAWERCDGADQDCDGAIDEGYDLDGDGFLTGLDAGCAMLGPTDCDDGDAAIHPGAVEVCSGIDEDCDGVLDPLDDADADGSTVCDDCDDADASVRPDAPEWCDARDNDCNGVSDEPWDRDGDGVGDCLDCDDGDPVVFPGAVELCDGLDGDCDAATAEGADGDGDGLTVCGGDCDDGRSFVFPGAVELCDGLDGDCDGVADGPGVCGGCQVEAYGGHSYLFCPGSVSWLAARAECQSYGYDLAAIGDAAEDLWVMGVANAVASIQWWIGFEDRGAEGVFGWSNGEPVAYTNWGPGEPNNSGNEDCTETNWGFDSWNDGTCFSAYPYVCESL